MVANGGEVVKTLAGQARKMYYFYLLILHAFQLFDGLLRIEKTGLMVHISISRWNWQTNKVAKSVRNICTKQR